MTAHIGIGSCAAMTCPATVTVVGIGTFQCQRTGQHSSVAAHTSPLPAGDKWATVMWQADNTVVAPPGSRRRPA